MERVKKKFVLQAANLCPQQAIVFICKHVPDLCEPCFYFIHESKSEMRFSVAAAPDVYNYCP
jgi:hypothetical protein